MFSSTPMSFLFWSLPSWRYQISIEEEDSSDLIRSMMFQVLLFIDLVHGQSPEIAAMTSVFLGRAFGCPVSTIALVPLMYHTYSILQP